MRNYVNNFSNASERSTGILAFTGAGYTVEGSHDLSFINIDSEAKTVEFSDTHNAGTQLYSVREVMAILDTPAVSPVSEPTPESVENNKVYVVARFAGNVEDVEELFIANGWTVSGNRTMPNINFKPDSKEITFASIPSGERLISKEAVLALLGKDQVLPPTAEAVVEEEVEAAIAAEEVEEETDAVSIPSLFAGLVIPKADKYKTDAVASTKAYAVRILTDGDMELTGDSEDFAVVIN